MSYLLSPVARWEPPIPGRWYRQLGVRWWGEGAYERQVLEGGTTRYAQLNRVESGDVVINKIWARNGSVAVVPEKLDGCYVSAEFPLYSVDPGRADAAWVRWLSRWPGFWERCERAAQGTSGKNRIRPSRFLNVAVPLPPLVEQRRLTGCLDDLAVRSETLAQDFHRASDDASALWAQAMSVSFHAGTGSLVRLEDVCDDIVDCPHSTPRYDGDDVPCVRSQDVGWGSLDLHQAKRTSYEEYLERTRRANPRRRDVVLVREGDVGRCAVVDDDQVFSLGQRVVLLRPRHTIDSRFLALQIMAPRVLDTQLRASLAGTTSHHVNVAQIRQIEVVVPSLVRQKEVVARLQELRSRLDRLAQLRSETLAAALDLPLAVLEKTLSPAGGGHPRLSQSASGNFGTL